MWLLDASWSYAADHRSMAGTGASPVRPSPLNPNASSRSSQNPLSPTTQATGSLNGSAVRGMPYYEKLREDLRVTLAEKSKLESQLSHIEENIYGLEEAYLASTSAAGNIVVGFEGYMKAAATSHAPVAPIPTNELGADGFSIGAPTPYAGTFTIGAALLTGGLLTAGLSTAGLGQSLGGRKPRILDEHRIFSNASITWTQARLNGADLTSKDTSSGVSIRKERLNVPAPAPILTIKQIEPGLDNAKTPVPANGDTPMTGRLKKANKKKGKREAPADEDDKPVEGKTVRPGKRLKISFGGVSGGGG